ncbi:hypothetical protein JCM10212_006381 [Sporobolomyces blumeae]
MSKVRLGEVKSIQGWDRRAKQDKPAWADVPRSRIEHGRQLLDLSPACFDRLLAEPALNLRDHLALAATCRKLRACYYSGLDATGQYPLRSPLWAGLMSIRPVPEYGATRLLDPALEDVRAVHSMGTNGSKVDHAEMIVVAGVEEQGGGGEATGEGSSAKKRTWDEGIRGWVVRSLEWEEAIKLVHCSRMSKTDATSIYKLTETELESYLRAFLKGTPSKPSGRVSTMYLEAAVESLAFRLHNGPDNHRLLLARRAVIAAKAKQTREQKKRFNALFRSLGQKTSDQT